MQGTLIRYNQVVLKITLIIDKLFHSLMQIFVSHYVGICMGVKLGRWHCGRKGSWGCL